MSRSSNDTPLQSDKELPEAAAGNPGEGRPVTWKKGGQTNAPYATSAGDPLPGPTGSVDGPSAPVKE